jgi:hypothetical protein
MQLRKTKLTDHVARVVENFGRPRNAWQDNIKADIKDMEWERVGWVN